MKESLRKYMLLFLFYTNSFQAIDAVLKQQWKNLGFIPISLHFLIHLRKTQVKTVHICAAENFSKKKV